jgi:hypothetical protein
LALEYRHIMTLPSAGRHLGRFLLSYGAAGSAAAVLIWLLYALPGLIRYAEPPWAYLRVFGILWGIVMSTAWLPAVMALTTGILLQRRTRMFFIGFGGLGGFILPLAILIGAYAPYWLHVSGSGAIPQILGFMKEEGWVALLAGAAGGYVFWKVFYSPSREA